VTTVAHQATAHKTPQAYYAHLDETPGALTNVHGTLYFVSDHDVTEITPAHINFLVVLGNMPMADAQRIDDRMAGGPAGVACSRAQGVA
jgi:hypothetical protein